MKAWPNIFRFVTVIIGVGLIAFSAELYFICDQQRAQIDLMAEQQNTDFQLNNGKFKYQQEAIERLGRDLDDAQQQIKDQNDALSSQKEALVQEVEQRQQAQDASKNFQTALVDIKAEADAIKQDTRQWQKDYVAVLAQVDKKADHALDEFNRMGNALMNLNIPQMQTDMSVMKVDISSLKSDIEKLEGSQDNKQNEDQTPGLSGQASPQDQSQETSHRYQTLL